MAKQKIPTSIQNKFNRQQFKVGDYVYIMFLGQKYYGYVKKVTERSGTFVYMVQTNKYSYPCGIQIDEYSNGTAGNILVNDTKRIGEDEIKRRFDVRQLPRNTRRPAAASKDKSSDNRGSVKATNNKVLRPKKSSNKRGADVIQPSNTENSNTAPKRRKSYSKLDEAIEKQKSFLRKFT